MTNKLYVTPETEVLEVRFEENIMSADGKWDNSIKSGSTWGSSAYSGNDNPYGLE